MVLRCAVARRNKRNSKQPAKSALPDDVLVAIYAWTHGLYPELGHQTHGTWPIAKPAGFLLDFLRVDDSKSFDESVRRLEKQGHIKTDMTHNVYYHTGAARAAIMGLSRTYPKTDSYEYAWH